MLENNSLHRIWMGLGCGLLAISVNQSALRGRLDGIGRNVPFYIPLQCRS